MGWIRRFIFLVFSSLVVACGSDGDDGPGTPPGSEVDFTTFEWTELNGDAPWAARAGLHTVELGGRFYLMGGRTPLDPESLPFPIPGASEFWADVWVSDDEGVTWERVLESDTPGHWAPRAYFQTVVKGNSMFVLGGQDFPLELGATSNFFNDVWSSEDGVTWTELTSDLARWRSWVPLCARALRASLLQRRLALAGRRQLGARDRVCRLVAAARPSVCGVVREHRVLGRLWAS
jgi:hypothetical protein